MLKLALATGLALAALSTTAYAADIAQPAMTSATSATDWSGFYAGLNVGYGPGTVSSGYFEEDSGSVSFSGLFIGGQAGYNFQLQNGVVFGLEGDLNWSNESGNTNETEDSGYYNYSETSTLNWFGAVTGHVGYAWDNFMPYVLGGVAFANNTLAIHDTEEYGAYTEENDSSNATHMGYTVGGGVAAMLTDKISGFVEARYADYGSANYSFTYETTDHYTAPASIVDTTVRGGLNFHF